MKNRNISSPTAAKIFSAWEKEGRSEVQRKYLGASIIGHDCDMYLWLNFRGVVRESFDGRMYRLFDRGKREEAVFCDDLRKIGCEVREFDESGNQFAVSDFGGHFSGHLDGIVRGLDEAPKQWFVTEFKTHSDASFKKLCKEGVRKAKPMHYDQMQTYMGKTGLKKALYMAVDKDNDDLWVETVEFDQAAYDLILARAKHIIDTVQPDRCAKRPDDYRCKACPHSAVCWHTSDNFVDPSIPETCRTCCHSTADTEHDGASWICRKGHSCSYNGKCDDYLILPVFVKGEIVNGDENGIRYAYENGTIVIGKNGITVDEAKKFGPKEADSVLALKSVAPDAKVVASNALELKYMSDAYEIYFKGDQEKMVKWNCGIINMTKPLATEDHGEFQLYEFEDGWCVKHEPRNGLFTVYGERPPF